MDVVSDKKISCNCVYKLPYGCHFLFFSLQIFHICAETKAVATRSNKNKTNNLSSSKANKIIQISVLLKGVVKFVTIAEFELFR